MTIITCIDCKKRYNDVYKWLFVSKSKELGLCMSCYACNKQQRMEDILTKKQLQELKGFEDEEFERFKKEVEDFKY